MATNPVIRGTDVVLEAGRKFSTGSEAGFPVESNDPRLRGVLFGTFAQRPVATTYGVGWYFATDYKSLYWSDGATWTGTSQVPLSGLDANRPAASADLVGKFWYSTDLVALYLCGPIPSWIPMPAGGSSALQMDDRVLNANFTITANKSVVLAGPFEIASGVTLEIFGGGILEVG